MKRLFSHAVLVLSVVILFGVGQAFAGMYKPGTYDGSAMGRATKATKTKKGHSGMVKVEVTVTDSKITDIKVVTYEQSLDHKKYGPRALEAKEKIPAAIIAKQSLDVDTVAKATMSSSAIQLAVAKALEKARVQ